MAERPTRHITTDDLYNLKMVSDPAFSPDGQRIAYVVTRIDQESNGYFSEIHIANADGTGDLRLTTAKAKDTRPRWSPDGKFLAFLSDRDEKNQIWMIRSAGGESWQVSKLAESVGSFSWSPDGTSFVAVSKTTQNEANPAGTGEDGGEEEAETDVRHITKIRYKSDDEGFLDMKPRNLWIIPAFDGVARQLTDSDVHDTDPIWSPNGREIAFVSNRTEGREWNTVSEIWAVAAESGAERPLFSGDTASFGSPSWSPDGSALSAIGHWEAAAGGSPDANIWTVPAGGGEHRNITDELPRSTTDSAMSDMFQASDLRPVWAPDGSAVYFLASDSGSTHIHRVLAGGGEISRLTEGRCRISGLTISPDGSKLAYIKATSTIPGDLYISAVDGGNEHRLSAVNEEFLSGIALSEPEPFWVDAEDDAKIQAWTLKPPGFDASKRYPMILQIHGGPHGMYADAFMHEFQLMVARGYVVIYCNPRGSSGYGEPFTRDTHLRWGGTDMPDVMAVVDHVLEQGYIDEARMGVTGGSYGGYMTLWVIGHTDRFKAAVAQRCVSNLFSFYGTSDIGWTFIDYEFGGAAWDQREHFMKYSPISYVEEMTTPLLLIHSERDFRCPIEQAEQVFISLKKLGREVEFVRFPDENHNLSRSGKPKHRIERLEHIMRWFDQHL